jgi:hypothetical protein
LVIFGVAFVVAALFSCCFPVGRVVALAINIGYKRIVAFFGKFLSHFVGMVVYAIQAGRMSTPAFFLFGCSGAIENPLRFLAAVFISYGFKLCIGLYSHNYK